MSTLTQFEPFPSLAIVQEHHATLAKDFSAESTLPEKIKIARDFIGNCVATGRVLESPADRAAVQSLVTFWANRVDRLARSEVSEVENESAESDDYLLLEFEQDAFNTIVIAPTEAWIQGLSEADQTLTRRLVLRLINLRADGTFEAIPTTRIILESLEPYERAKELLAELIKLGVVRTLRETAEFKEFALQPLDRLKCWESLQEWKLQRLRFRELASKSVAQFAVPSKTSHPFAEGALRLLRENVLHAGSLIQVKLERVWALLPMHVLLVAEDIGLRRRVEPTTEVTEKEFEEAENYRDKNASEVKFIYQQRQLDKQRLVVIQERVFGITATAGCLGLMACVALVLMYVAFINGRKAENTLKLSTLQIANQQLNQSLRHQTTDSSAALLFAATALENFDSAKSILTARMAAQLRDSYLYTLNAAISQSPNLIGIASPAPSIPDGTTGASTDTKRSEVKANVLSSNGEVYLKSSLINNAILFSFGSIDDTGNLKLDKERKLDLSNQKLRPDSSLSAYVHGPHAVFAISSESGKYLLLFRADRDSNYQQIFDRFDSLVMADGRFSIAGESFGLTANHYDPSQKKSTGTIAVWRMGETWQKFSWTFDGVLGSMSIVDEIPIQSGRGLQKSKIKVAAATSQDQNPNLIACEWKIDEEFPNNKPDETPFYATAIRGEGSANKKNAFVTHSGARPNLLFVSSDRDDGKAWLIQSDLQRVLPLYVDFVTNAKWISSQISTAAFSSFGNYLAIGRNDGHLGLWRLTKDSTVDAKAISLAPSTSHSQQVFGMTFSKDDNYLITGSRDKRVMLLDVNTGRSAANPMWHAATVSQVFATPDGHRVRAVVKDAVFTWELPFLRFQSTELGIREGHIADTEAVSAEGHLLVAGGERRIGEFKSGWLRAWDTSNGESVNAEIGTQKPIVHVAVNSSGELFSAIDESGAIRVYSRTGQLKWEEPICDEQRTFATFGDHSQSQRLLTLGRELTFVEEGRTRIQVFECDTATQEFSSNPIFDSTYPAPLNSARFSQDGNNFVAIANDGTAVVGDILTKNIEPLTRKIDGKEPTKAHAERITCAGFSPDGKRIVTTSEDDHAYVWQKINNQWTAELLDAYDNPNISPHTGNINFGSFDQSGEKVVTASADGRGIVWQWSAKAKRLQAQTSIQLNDSDNGMIHAQFLDDRFIMGTWDDNSVHVWDTLRVHNPLNNKITMVNGREIAAFQSAHPAKYSYFAKDSDKSGNPIWILSVLGREQTQTPGPLVSHDALNLREDNDLHFVTQYKVSHWQFGKVESLEGVDVMASLATVISARQIVGDPLKWEPRPLASVIGDWSNRKTGALKRPSKEELVDFHTQEAWRSELAATPEYEGCLWHWRKVEDLLSGKLPTKMRLHRASVYALSGNWSDASRELNSIERTSRDIDFLLTRAALNISQQSVQNSNEQNRNAAIEDYKSIIALEPENPYVRWQLAKQYSAAKKYEEALEQYDELLENSEDPDPDLLLTRCIAAIKSNQLSERCFTDYKKAGKKFSELSRFDSAIKAYNGALAQPVITPTEKAEIYARIAKISIEKNKKTDNESEKQKNRKTAAENFQRAIESDPENAVYAASFARNMVESDGYTWKFIDDAFQSAIRLAPKDPILVKQRIAALLPPKRPEGNVDGRFERALEILNAHPALLDDSISTLQKAAIHVYLKDYASAEKTLSQANEKQTSALIRLRLALIQLKIEKIEDYRDTVATMNKGVSAEDFEANNAAWCAAYAANSVSDFEPLVKRTEQALKDSFNQSPDSLNTLGAIYFRAGRNAAAIGKLNEATKYREKLSALHSISNEQLLFGNALDKLFISMASAESFEAAENLAAARTAFQIYQDHWPTSVHFADWIWNSLEFEVLTKDILSQPPQDQL